MSWVSRAVTVSEVLVQAGNQSMSSVSRAVTVSEVLVQAGNRSMSWVSRAVTVSEVLTLAGNQSRFTLQMRCRLRWLVHVHRIADGKIPKDLATTQLRR